MTNLGILVAAWSVSHTSIAAIATTPSVSPTTTSTIGTTRAMSIPGELHLVLCVNSL